MYSSTPQLGDSSGVVLSAAQRRRRSVYFRGPASVPAARCLDLNSSASAVTNVVLQRACMARKIPSSGTCQGQGDMPACGWHGQGGCIVGRRRANADPSAGGAAGSGRVAGAGGAGAAAGGGCRAGQLAPARHREGPGARPCAQRRQHCAWQESGAAGRPPAGDQAAGGL